MDDEAEEMARYERIKAAAKHYSELPEDRLRHVMYELILTLYGAVDDLDKMSELLHPADVVSKHLQRGNIIKDGRW